MKLIFVILALYFSCSVHARSICDSPVTRELEQCARKNYEEADFLLNRDFSKIKNGLSNFDKTNLLAVQRYWIQYKSRYCQDAFDTTYSGKEAGIEKWSCLESVTDSRSREINFIYGDSNMEDYKSALNFMADEYEGGDRAKIISKLARSVPDSDSPDWTKYRSANCKITYEKLGEDHDACVARMNFYKNW